MTHTSVCKGRKVENLRRQATTTVNHPGGDGDAANWPGCGFQPRVGDPHPPTNRGRRQQLGHTTSVALSRPPTIRFSERPLPPPPHAVRLCRLCRPLLNENPGGRGFGRRCSLAQGRRCSYTSGRGPDNPCFQSECEVRSLPGRRASTREVGGAPAAKPKATQPCRFRAFRRW